MKQDDFGDRMKSYEKLHTDARIGIDQVLCVRIDGKGFSKFTEHCIKPFDGSLTATMQETTRRLVDLTHANIGYTQSDEITLIFTPGDHASEYMFGGKVSKVNSILASMATANFNDVLRTHSGFQTNKLAYFDCRAWGVPNIMEASNVLLWRAQDARKNSISSFFRWNMSHAKMKNLSGKQMIEVLKNEKGLDWHDLPDYWKYGSYYKSMSFEQHLTQEEYLRIPAKHRPADMMVTRHKVIKVDIGNFGDLSLENRIGVIEK